MFAAFFAWLVPGGPLLTTVATFLGALLKGLGRLLAAAWEGFTRMLANPATFVTVGLIALAAYGLGVRRGILWDGYKVDKARRMVAELQLNLDDRTKERDLALQENAQWKGRLDEQNARAGAAETARRIAEDKARAALAARDRAVARAGGLLKPAGGNAKAGPQAAAGPGLPSLSGLFGGAGK
jgi:hypothetical protein